MAERVSISVFSQRAVHFAVARVRLLFVLSLLLWLWLFVFVFVFVFVFLFVFLLMLFLFVGGARAVQCSALLSRARARHPPTVACGPI